MKEAERIIKGLEEMLLAVPLKPLPEGIEQIGITYRPVLFPAKELVIRRNCGEILGIHRQHIETIVDLLKSKEW